MYLLPENLEKNMRQRMESVKNDAKRLRKVLEFDE